jgi:hypothetical protein
VQVQLYQRNDSDSTFAPIQGEGCEWLFHRRKIRGSFPFGKLRVRITIRNITAILVSIQYAARGRAS